MYSVALLLLLLAVVTFLTARGLRRRSRLAMVIGLGVATSILIVFGLFSAWGAMLWLEDAAMLEHLWTVAGATTFVSVVAALSAAALVAVITLLSRHADPRTRRVGMIVAAAAGAAWGAASWPLVLRFVLRTPPATREPTAGRDVGFHVLTLPLVDALFSLLLLVAMISAIVLVWSTHGGRPRRADALAAGRPTIAGRARFPSRATPRRAAPTRFSTS